MLGEAANIIIAVTIVFGTLAVISVGLRLYCRTLQKLSYGLDDFLILAALVRFTRPYTI